MSLGFKRLKVRTLKVNGRSQTQGVQEKDAEENILTN